MIEDITLKVVTRHAITMLFAESNLDFPVKCVLFKEN